jgi:hypothetical protein
MLTPHYHQDLRWDQHTHGARDCDSLPPLSLAPPHRLASAASPDPFFRPASLSPAALLYTLDFASPEGPLQQSWCVPLSPLPLPLLARAHHPPPGTALTS